jgi:outer membrane protein
MLRAVFRTIFLLVIAGQGHATNVGLVGIFNEALDKDPSFQVAKNELNASGFLQAQAKADLLPSIQLEGFHSDVNQNIISSTNQLYGSGSVNYPTKSIALTATQPLFNRSLWLGYSQAKTKVKQAVISFGVAEQDLILRSANAYLNALAAHDVLMFTKAEHSAIKEQLDLVRVKHDSGLVAKAELHDAVARFSLSQADLISAVNGLDDSLRGLQELTGSVVKHVRPMRENFELKPPSPEGIGYWIQDALKQNLMMKSRRLSVELAEQEVQRQKAGHLPVLGLVVSSGREDTGDSLFGGGSDIQTNKVMLKLSVPLFSGGGTVARVGEAVTRIYSAKDELEREHRQVERKTRGAYRAVVGGIARVDALQSAVIAQESARHFRVQGQYAGTETTLAVLDAERDLYSAKRDLARARYEFVLSRLMLKQAVGTLNLDDIIEIDRLLIE